MSARRAPDRAERVAALRLFRTTGVGPVTFRAWTAPFGGSAALTLRALPELVRRSGRTKTLRLAPEQRAASELEKLEAMGGRLLLAADEGWPPLLNFDDAPPLLSCLGERLDALAGPAAAIVGSRRCSPAGRRFAAAAAAAVAKEGWLVVSGMAVGIDAAAHEGCAPRPTAAAVAGGVDVSYPRENEALRDDVLDRGALVSEAPLGQAPMARHFPRRNRLISGISTGTLVVEATRQSGSLGTAEHAREQGRLLMAVPGAARDSRGRGVDALLDQRATRVESPADVVRALEREAKRREGGGPKERPKSDLFREGFDGGIDEALPGEAEGRDAREAVAAALAGGGPEEPADLVRRAGLPPRAVGIASAELELAGALERFDDGRVRLSSEGAAR